MKIPSFLIKLKTRFQRFFSKKPYVIVAMGDSAVEGWGATSPKRAFAPLVYSSIKLKKQNVNFYNLGKAQARVEDVLNTQLNQAIKLQPDLILLSIGANDILWPLKAWQFDKNYGLLLKSLSQKTDALIVVNNIPDFSIAPIIPKLVLPLTNILAKRFNKIIQKYTDETGGVLVDLYAQSSLIKDKKGFISDDGLHPSDKGYALWKDSIIDKISPLI
ncbi:SGNH/GDSL hydrolase family protein [Candidatus Daviesbacteria bacterium]|nr:SGNH/GDSL hydrolase family protein [Candidatus Daviesbacteria bacterium]